MSTYMDKHQRRTIQEPESETVSFQASMSLESSDGFSLVELFVSRFARGPLSAQAWRKMLSFTRSQRRQCIKIGFGFLVGINYT